MVEVLQWASLWVAVPLILHVLFILLCRMRCKEIKGTQNYFVLFLCTQVQTISAHILELNPFLSFNSKEMQVTCVNASASSHCWDFPSTDIFPFRDIWVVKVKALPKPACFWMTFTNNSSSWDQMASAGWDIHQGVCAWWSWTYFSQVCNSIFQTCKSCDVASLCDVIENLVFFCICLFNFIDFIKQPTRQVQRFELNNMGASLYFVEDEQGLKMFVGGLCSVGSILGCEADILQLDVMDVKMDFHWSSAQIWRSMLSGKSQIASINPKIR